MHTYDERKSSAGFKLIGSQIREARSNSDDNGCH